MADSCPPSSHRCDHPTTPRTPPAYSDRASKRRRSDLRTTDCWADLAGRLAARVRLRVRPLRHDGARLLCRGRPSLGLGVPMLRLQGAERFSDTATREGVATGTSSARPGRLPHHEHEAPPK